MGMTEVTTLAEGEAEDKDLGYYEWYYQSVPLHLTPITTGFQSLQLDIRHPIDAQYDGGNQPCRHPQGWG